MSRLEDKIAVWVAAHPGKTVVEIARAVGCRDQAARAVLASPLFRADDGLGRAKTYVLSTLPSLPVPASQAASGRQPTQCQQLLRILRDGRWHSTRELLAAVPCIVHSRINDLRDQGYTIPHETRGKGAGGSFYRLAAGALLEQGAVPLSGMTAAPCSSGVPSNASAAATRGEAAVYDPAVGAANLLSPDAAQLTLDDLVAA